MANIEKTAIWHRLRVAALGLVIVSLSIFSANIVVEKAIDEPDLANANLQQDIAETGAIEAIEESSTEPLAELGVTPVPKEDSDTPLSEVAEPGANPVVEGDALVEGEILEEEQP